MAERAAFPGGLPHRRRLPGRLPPVFWGILLALWLAAPPVPAAEPPAPSRASALLSAHTRWSVDQARAGEQMALTIVITIAQGFHINADAGQITPQAAFHPYPTRVDIEAHSPGVVVGPPQYPPAHTIGVGFTSQPLAVFDGRMTITLPVEVSANAAGDSIEIRLALHYQGCDATSCWMPAATMLTARLPMVSKRLP